MNRKFESVLLVLGLLKERFIYFLFINFCNFSIKTPEIRVKFEFNLIYFHFQ